MSASSSALSDLERSTATTTSDSVSVVGGAGSGPLKISGDLDAVKRLVSFGADDLNKCYQCATCAIVCPISPDGNPFPRKEMILAQWGQTDRLLGSMDPWLCHNCNDCSTHCPRDAKPGDVLGAIRAMAVRHFSPPQFIANAASSAGGIALLFAIPAVILAIAVLGNDSALSFVDAETIRFSQMMPLHILDPLFMAACAFAGLMAYKGLREFIGAMQKEYPKGSGGMSLSAAVYAVIADIRYHTKFKECGDEQAGRGKSHFLMMYGFIGLFITTNLVLVIHYGNVLFGLWELDTPLPFFHPVKILGNVSAVAAFIGVAGLVSRRMSDPEAGRSSLFDWVFLWNMALTVVTGILCQVIRVAEASGPAYVMYYLHLIMVFFLLAYAPHTKFAHLFYRTAAMVYARYVGRA